MEKPGGAADIAWACPKIPAVYVTSGADRFPGQCGGGGWGAQPFFFCYFVR